MTSAGGSIQPLVVTDRRTACEAGSGSGSFKLIPIGAAQAVQAGYAGFSCRVFPGKIIELPHA